MNPGFTETYYLIDNLTLAVPTEPALAFYYDDRGHRVRKENFVYAGDEPIRYITWYVRDASGSPLAIYQGTADETQTTADLKELPIYGLSRLGIYQKYMNDYVYQLTDHLGNVRATLRRGKDNELYVVGATDYYPFGMPMPNRQITGSENYRYAYQGQDKDPETGKEAFELRLWDGRIGRWLTTDPKKAGVSPYWGMNNNPVSVIDPDGGEGEWHYDDDGNLVSDAGDTAQSLAIFKGISISEAQNIINTEGFITDFTTDINGSNGLYGGQVSFNRDFGSPYKIGNFELSDFGIGGSAKGWVLVPFQHINRTGGAELEAAAIRIKGNVSIMNGDHILTMEGTASKSNNPSTYTVANLSAKYSYDTSKRAATETIPFGSSPVTIAYPSELEYLGYITYILPNDTGDIKVLNLSAGVNIHSPVKIGGSNISGIDVNLLNIIKY